MAIHITTPENSRIIKFEINNLGALKIDALSPQLNVDSLNLETIKSQIVKVPDLKPADYQSVLASLIIGNREKATEVLNIQYINPPKATGKPVRFEVGSRNIIKF
jgi:hypothetical protein